MDLAVVMPHDVLADKLEEKWPVGEVAPALDRAFFYFSPTGRDRDRRASATGRAGEECTHVLRLR